MERRQQEWDRTLQLEEAKLQVQAQAAGIEPREASKIRLRAEEDGPQYNEPGRLEALAQAAARPRP